MTIIEGVPAGVTAGSTPYPRPVSKIEIRAVRYGSLVAQQLVADALADLGTRYGGSGDDTPVDPREFDPPAGAFLVAYLGGEPVGCGGWRSHGDSRATAELKRMYTAPEARGRGVARVVLAAVERSAREYGRKVLILECGERQPEAISLYQRCGYERIPNFGFYRDLPSCVSFARAL